MKNYIQSSFLKLRKIGERIRSASILSDTSWLLLAQDDSAKIVYIFKSQKNELYQSFNGNVNKGKWEFIVDSDSLVIDTGEQTELYNATLVSDDFLFLKKDGDSKSLVFANFTKYKDWLKSEVFKKLNTLDAFEQKPEMTVETAKQPPSPYPLLETKKLIEPLEKLKPRLHGVQKAIFYNAIEYILNGKLYRQYDNWETPVEISIRRLGRYLENENEFKPLQQVYFNNRKSPDFIEKLKVELSGYLNLSD